MNRDEFVRWASDGPIGERQAEAFYRRHIAGESRQEAADAMDTSASNVDNLERAGRQRIMQARNLINLVDGLGYDGGRSIGVCAECDQPVESLRPHPDHEDAKMENWVLICEDCHGDISE